jgi:hypothetical protein
VTENGPATPSASCGRGVSRPTLVALALLAVLGNAIAAVELSSQMISAAYAFAPDQVSSIDELYLVGQGPRDAIACFAVAFIIGSLITLILLMTGHYEFTWVIPLVAVGASYLLFVVFVCTFHAPPYEGG